MAQSVEHVIGNDEVISSILITSSKKIPVLLNGDFWFYYSKTVSIFFEAPEGEYRQRFM